MTWTVVRSAEVKRSNDERKEGIFVGRNSEYTDLRSSVTQKNVGVFSERLNDRGSRGSDENY